MKLQKAKVNDTCLLTSFAMALDVDQSRLMLTIGSDPHEKLWPDLLEPECFRGHHIQEMIDAALDMDYAVTEIQVRPSFWQLGLSQVIPLLDNDGTHRLLYHVENTQGVFRLATHAVAWDGKMVYDPQGTMYRIETILNQIQSYYIVGRILDSI